MPKDKNAERHNRNSGIFMNAPFLRIDDFESKKSDRVLFYFPNELINFKRYWMNIKQASLTIASIGLLPFCPLVAQEEILVDALIGIGPKGKGNDQAVEAWVEVPKLTASSIPNLLKAMNEANDLGDNWIRGAVSQILSQKDGSMPERQIIDFIRDADNSGSARKFAFEVLRAKKLKMAVSMISTFIDDREPSLRRLAVDKLLQSARDSRKPEKAKALFRTALAKGREVDQIKEARDALEEYGVGVNIQSLMGFLTKWDTIGPFDNTGRQGFATAYPPEKKIEAKALYQGKSEKVGWSGLSTSDPFGMLNVNLQYGEVKEALAYAHTQFHSKSDQPAQFRIGSKNAWKLWVNGELLFARDEYHRGKTRVDQFVVEGELKKGVNSILVKVCQNEQTQSWTKQWEFCLRITDPSGTVINPSSSLKHKK